MHLTLIILLLLSQPHKQVNKLNVLSHFRTSECLFHLRPTLKLSDELLFIIFLKQTSKSIFELCIHVQILLIIQCGFNRARISITEYSYILVG